MSVSMDGPQENLAELPSSQGMENRPFRIRLHVPHGNLPRPWLCRRAGMDDEWSCGPVGAVRLFTWVTGRDSRKYLQDQDGYYLSHHDNGRVYTSSWTNAVSWRIKGDRLVTGQDLVLTWRPDSPGFLTAETPGHGDVTVEIMAAALPEVEKLRPLVKAVDGNPPDRTVFDPPRDRHAPRETTFFGLKDGPSSPGIPVYEIRTELGSRSFFAKFALMPDALVVPSFIAFSNDDGQPFLAQVYEHRSATSEQYRYDFNPEPNDQWQQGRPIFRAIPPDEVELALSYSEGALQAKDYAHRWVADHGGAFAILLKGMTAETMTRDTAAQLAGHFQASSPIFMSVGAGLHGGYGPGTAGTEFGSIWRSRDFGYVPMHEPVTDYSTEWVTFGPATGVDVGGSVDFLSVGMWFCEVGDIEGACNGVTISAQVLLGGAITLYWDGTWKGVGGSSHPIGITTVYAIGLEFGVGVFLNISATQFFKKRPGFPQR
jgi:hypothetical protein